MPAFYRTRRFYYLVVSQVVVVIVPTIVYYGLSYNSVNGTHPELITGYRSIGVCSTTYYVTVHVWSWAGSLYTQVSSPAFTLTVNNLPFGDKIGTSGSFQPNNYITYTLTLHVSDCGIASSIGRSNSTYVMLQMSR